MLLQPLYNLNIFPILKLKSKAHNVSPREDFLLKLPSSFHTIKVILDRDGNMCRCTTLTASYTHQHLNTLQPSLTNVILNLCSMSASSINPALCVLDLTPQHKGQCAAKSIMNTDQGTMPWKMRLLTAFVMNSLLRPKSVSTTCPWLSIRMFSSLMSL